MKWRWSLGIVTICIALWSSSANAQSRYALVIGHNVGGFHEEPLRFAERDAERLHDVLVRLGGVPKQNARLLIGPRAADVQGEHRKLAGKLAKLPMGGKEALLFVYYAGHGDDKDLHLGPTNLSRDALQKQLQALPAALKVVVIDACETPNVTQARGVYAAPSFDVGLIQPAHTKGLVLIRSTRKGEPAQESDRLGGAVFSHYWLSGLQGAADVDRNARVTLLEAYTFAYRHTVQRSALGSSAVQHPSFDLQVQGSGEITMTELAKSRSSLVFPREDNVRYLVYQRPQGTVMAELITSRQGPTELALPAGRFLVQRRQRDQFQVAEVDLPYGGRRKLSDHDFRRQEYEHMARRGGLIELNPSQALLGYQLRLDAMPSVWAARHGLELGYRHRWDSWWLGGSLSMQGGSYTQGLYESEEWNVEGSVLFGWRDYIGVTELHLGLGPAVTYIYQHRQRVDHERLKSIGSEAAEAQINHALNPGGTLDVHWFIPVIDRWSAYLSARGQLWVANMQGSEGESLELVPSLGFGAGVSFRF